VSPKRIWRIARNDVRLTLRDRAAFFWMLVLPLALMWLLGSASGGGGGRDDWKIALTVSNQDDGWLGRALVEELRDDRIDLREPPAAGAAEPADPVRTLTIPQRFTERVLAGEKTALRFEHGADSNVEYGFGAQVHVVRAIARTIGRLVELESTDADPEAAFRALGERPRLVDVEVSTAGRGTPVPSGFRQSVPGTLTMIVLMMTLIYGAVFLTIEKRTGMLRRQSGLPLRRSDIFLGKLVGRMLIAGMQLAVLALAGTLLFRVSWGSSPLGLLLMFVSFAAAVAGLATLLGAVLTTAEQASSVGWILSMFLAALGGCWWPAEVMPDWLRTASHVLPTAWAMDGFHALISFGRGVDAVLVPAAVLLGFAALFSIAGARLLRYD
jgi:ABC-type multidrug transport system permease subunit